MELEGVVHDGVIVPDDATALPEGTRVRITTRPGSNAAALLAAIEGPPHVTAEDVAELQQAIVAGKRPAAPINPFGHDSGPAARSGR